MFLPATVPWWTVSASIEWSHSTNKLNSNRHDIQSAAVPISLSTSTHSGQWDVSFPTWVQQGSKRLGEGLENHTWCQSVHLTLMACRCVIPVSGKGTWKLDAILDGQKSQQNQYARSKLTFTKLFTNLSIFYHLRRWFQHFF